MNDIKRIIFKQVGDQEIEILAVTMENPLTTVRIGHIFSKGSYSGKDSIQICGFDSLEGPWSCGAFNNSQDICLKWIDIEQWFDKKDKSKYKLTRKIDKIFVEDKK